MKSWKIGAVSGLIAGFIAGIVAFIFVNISLSIGLPFCWAPASIPPITEIATNEIVLSVIYGIILGIIYSKVYALIPGKGVLKALYYSLIMFVLSSVIIVTFLLAYGHYLYSASKVFSDFFLFTTYGLVLGFLYEFSRSRYYPSKEESKIVTYNMSGGIFPGAVAGIFNGITIFLTAIMVAFLTFYQQTYFWTIPGYLTDIGFLVSQLQAHILLNMVWGIVFGVIYTQVYNVVPSKGVLKGIVFSLVYFLIHAGRAAFGFALYGQLFSEAFVGFATAILGDGIVYGLVLGYLYKPPK